MKRHKIPQGSIAAYIVLLTSFASQSIAESNTYQWVIRGGDGTPFSSATGACEAAFEKEENRLKLSLPTKITFTGEWTRTCYANSPAYTEGVAGFAYATLGRIGNSCPEGSTYNVKQGECETEPFTSKNNGSLSIPSICNFTGNPINILNGNKFQIENDITSTQTSDLRFLRTYNSSTGLWTHSFSDNLYIGEKSIVLTRSDGRESIFQLISGQAYPEPAELGSLTKTSTGWTYKTFNKKLIFNAAGKLISLAHSNGQELTLSYNGGNTISVRGNSGQTLALKQDDLYQPTELSFNGVSVLYSYDSNRLLQKVTRMQSNQMQVRLYHYEDPRNPKLLTGITDERGIRYATWTYDDQGRAISSEHANGAEKVTLSYNADGSTTVTNE
ncbi:DUF6531 domain-containing protein, partial [Pseudomonas indica]|uniref:DUF6531 domain-containing protein n=1 Tax=Pseudomonas indica TaxID=137658 RepID=UPI001140C0E5